MFKKINPLRIVLIVLIIFIPLYPKFPLLNVGGTYVAIRLDDLVVALAVFVWFIYQIKNRFPILKQKIFYLFLAYYLAITASFFLALLIYQTDSPSILLLHLIRRFEYTSLFFIALTAIKSKKDLLFPYVSIIIATIFIIIYGYGQKYLQFPVISTMNSEFSKGQLLQMDSWTRINSTFAGHYDLAVFLSVVLVVIGGIIVISKNIWFKLFNIIVWLFSFHLLTLTASRVSTFAYFGGICLTIIILRKFLWIVPVSILFAASLISSKDLNQRLLATIPALKNQFFSAPVNTTITPTPLPITPTTIPIASTVPVIAYVTPIPTVFRHGPEEEFIPIDTDVGVARSGEIRFNAEWPRAINAFFKNPVFGTGLGSITLATDNDYLRSLGETGLLGFCTFFAIFLSFILPSLSLTFKKRPSYHINLCLIFFAALITFLANATLIDAFEASKTAYLFWIMMAIFHYLLHSHSADDRPS